MAFNINYLGRVSTSGNAQALKVWSYNATATGANDPIATVIASGYFDSVQQNLTAGLLSGLLEVGDVLHIRGNDSNGMYIVTSITTNVTVASYAASGSISSAQVNPNLIQYTTVSITAALFNTIFAAPIELVPAAGANTFIVLDRMQLLMTYGTVAYTVGGDVAVQYGTTAGGAGVHASTIHSAASFQSAFSFGANFNANAAIIQPFSSCVNQGLYISNAGAPFQTGDSNLVAHIWYKVVPSV